jgi:solute carrier family 25 folate transporter 32
LYRGVGPALLLTSHGAVQFAAYEEIRLVDVPPWLRPVWMLSAGAASKAVATTVTYPYQVIKSRIQARNSVYTGILDCASDAWR